MERKCEGCGVMLPPPPSSGRYGQPRKWCSDRCRSDTYNARARARTSRPVPVGERLRMKLRYQEDGCLVFTGYRNENSYGVISVENRAQLAHRVAWTLQNGPIPNGLQVLHRCDNPPCCNVGHLFLGTHEDNMADRDRKGRTLRGDALRKARWNR